MKWGKRPNLAGQPVPVRLLIPVTCGCDLWFISIALPTKYVKTLRSDSAWLSEYLVLAIHMNQKTTPSAPKVTLSKTQSPESELSPLQLDPTPWPQRGERPDTKILPMGIRKVLYYHLNAGDCFFVSLDFRPRDLFVASIVQKAQIQHNTRFPICSRRSCLCRRAHVCCHLDNSSRRNLSLHVVLSVGLTWIRIRWRDEAA